MNKYMSLPKELYMELAYHDLLNDRFSVIRAPKLKKHYTTLKPNKRVDLIKLRYSYTRAIANAIILDYDIKEYAYNDKTLIVRIDSVDEIKSYYMVQPASDIFKSSTSFKWIRISYVNNTLDMNIWNRNTLKPIENKIATPEVLFEGRAIATGYIEIISDTFKHAIEPIEDKDGAYSILEISYGITRAKNGNIRIDFGMTYTMKLESFYECVLHNFDEEYYILMNNKKYYNNKSINLLHLEKPPEEVMKLIAQKIMKDKLKEKTCGPLF